jgi:MGT family glycosyltransferase
VPDPPASLVHPGFLVPRAVGEPSTSLFPVGSGPAVLVSLSTTYQEQEPLLQRIVDALAGMEVRGLVTTSGHDGPSPLRVPPNVAVAGYVPHQSVLPPTDAVVSHAGLGTVAATLAAGVPLVCTPIARDQHLNTARVEALGVGLGCPDPTPDAIAEVLTRVLDDRAFADRAAAMAAESRAAGGAAGVVDLLEGLVRDPR